jgi:hypothetical protein
MLKQGRPFPLPEGHIWCRIFPLAIISINPSITNAIIVKSSTVMEPVRMLIERPIPA